jgi:hypothetical protein
LWWWIKMQWREFTSGEKIGVVLVVLSLAAILGLAWVGRLYALPFALPVVVIAGGSYGALTVARSMKEGPKRIVAYGVAVVLILALVGGCFADAYNHEDLATRSESCPIDFYLWVLPVGQVCF